MTTGATDASSSPLRRELAVAAYGAPPGLISSGYGPGADAATAAGHSRHHPFSHSHNPPTAFSYTSQRSPRRQRQPTTTTTTIHPYAGDNDSPVYPTSASSGGGNYTTSPTMHDHFEMPSAKRRKVSSQEFAGRASYAPTPSKLSPQQRGSLDESSSSLRKGPETGRATKEPETRRPSESLDAARAAVSPTVSKPKRVRTGCLTCRNRHLKCDEALPICLNCQKSNRKCERGVRLNFIDLKVEQPPYLLPPVDWKGKSGSFPYDALLECK